MKIYNAVPGEPLPLGRRWENNALRIVFDISAWVSAFGAGTVRLLHQRQGDAAPYPVSVTRTDADGTPNDETGTRVLWDVSNADTAQVCHFGRAELRYYAGREGAEEFLAKSDIWKTEVRDALGGAQADAPEAQREWLDELLSKADGIEANVAAAQAAQERTEAVAKQTEEQFLYIDRDPESETYGFLMWVHDVKTPEVIASGDGWTFDTEATLIISRKNTYGISFEMNGYSPAVKRIVWQGESENIGTDITHLYYPSVTSVVIGGNVTSIGNVNERSVGPFGDMNLKTPLTNVSMGDNVTTIGAYAFRYCRSLTNIDISSNANAIGQGAFQGCISLASVKIPYGVTKIETSTFEDCSALTSVTLPDSLTSIGFAAFRSCYLLANVTIPDSVTGIGQEAFHYCRSLTSVTIPDSVTSVSSQAFSNCTSLASVKISENTRYIDTRAFYYCSALTSVTIPDGVTSIGSYAFYNTGLTDVYYKGSEEQRNAITIASGNEPLTSATWHYNWEG